MSLDVSINLSTEDDAPEIEVTLSCYVIKMLAAEVDEIDRRFGPNRDVGPVRFIIREGETLITIGTQKQGDQEYHLGEYGEFKEGHPV